MKLTEVKKMKLVIAALIAFGLASSAHASVRVYNPSGTLIGTYTDLKFATSMSVSQVSGKAQVSAGPGGGTATHYGFLQNRISGTSGSTTALTYAQCGSTITNDFSATYTLPSISGDSTGVGCRYTFIVNGLDSVAGGQITIRPTSGEQIVLLTDKQGDAITADATGESVVLESFSNLKWAPVGKEQGTFTDVN